MNTQIALNALTKLKINGMAKVYQALLAMPVQEQPTLHSPVARLAEAELQESAEKKTTMFLRFSKLRYIAVLENILCNVQPNFTNDHLPALTDCSFIDRSQNVLL